jgi:hypothetical protein
MYQLLTILGIAIVWVLLVRVVFPRLGMGG